jgi:hypothetical protein
LRAARSGRHGRDPGRARRVLRRGIVASLDYKRKRSVRVCPSSRRRVAKYLKRRQQNLRDPEGGTGEVLGRPPARKWRREGGGQ